MGKYQRPPLLNSSGFSIMEVVVASAIGAIVMAAMANMSYQQQLELASADAKIGSLSLQRDVQMLLQDSTACMNALQTKSDFSDGMAMSFNLGWKDGVMFAANNSPPSYGVKINKLNFVKLGIPVGTIYSGNLEVSAEAAKGRKLAFNKLLIPIWLTVNASNEILGCTTAPGATANGSCPITTTATMYPGQCVWCAKLPSTSNPFPFYGPMDACEYSSFIPCSQSTMPQFTAFTGKGSSSTCPVCMKYDPSSSTMVYDKNGAPTYTCLGGNWTMTGCGC